MFAALVAVRFRRCRSISKTLYITGGITALATAFAGGALLSGSHTMPISIENLRGLRCAGFIVASLCIIGALLNIHLPVGALGFVLTVLFAGLALVCDRLIKSRLL
jgi:hypothetical protein